MSNYLHLKCPNCERKRTIFDFGLCDCGKLLTKNDIVKSPIDIGKENRERDEYITLFLNCHQGIRIIYEDEIQKSAKYRHMLNFLPKGVSLVSDEFSNLEFMVLYQDDSSPDQFLREQLVEQ